MTTRKKVLIVDDEPGLRELLADRFGDAGWETAVASDGVEALTMIHAGPVDLILLDLMMPNLDGLGFLKKVKDDPAVAGSAIVILTVSASGEDIKNALALGARDYFLKSHDSIEKILQWAETYTTTMESPVRSGGDVT